MNTIHRHFAPACVWLLLLLALTSSAASLTATNSAKKTYIIGLKDTAWKPTREELANGASPVYYYLLNHNLYVPEENRLHFLNEFIIDLDDTECAALFNREWTGTEIRDAKGNVLQRHAKLAGKDLTKAEIDALYHPARGTRAVHGFVNLSAIDEDSHTVGLCALWPTNGFPTRPMVPDPRVQQYIGPSLERMNVGTTNGFLPWATSPFPPPYINGQFKPLTYPGTTNRIGVAVIDSGIDAYSDITNANVTGYNITITNGTSYSDTNGYNDTNVTSSYKHPDLEDIPFNTNGPCTVPTSTNCSGSHSFRAFSFGYEATNGATIALPDYVDVGDGYGHGHGTAVASVIAALDNGFGIVGIAPGVEIWNVRCVGPYPYNTWSYAHKGLNFVLANADQIAVANMSFGNVGGNITTGPGSNHEQLERDMMRLVQAGVVLVAAAGNGKMDIRGPDGIYGTGDDFVPAAFQEVISVSGMNAHDGTFYGWNPNSSSYTNGDGSNYGPVALGIGGLTKSGAGTLTLNSSNSYSGNTTVSGGVLAVNDSHGFGSSTQVEVSSTTGGALGGTRITLGAGVAVPSTVALSLPCAGTTVRSCLFAAGACAWNGPITLNGDGAVSPSDQIAFASAAGFMSIGSNIANVSFPGTLQLRGDGTGSGSAVGATNGYGGLIAGTVTLDSAATVQVHDGTTWTIASTGNTWNITEIAKGTMRIGANNALPTATTVKFGAVGNATLDLNGFNQQVGALTFVGNVATVTNSSPTSDATLTYAGGATYYAGFIKDGLHKLNLAVATGTLTLSNAASLNLTTSTVSVASGAVLDLEFTGTNTVAGFVTNGVSAGSGVYNSTTGSPYLTGTGSLVIPSPGPSGPAQLTNSISGSTLTFTWPAGQSWRLESQTNSLSVGLTTNGWGTVPGGIDGSNSITIDSTKPTVFYRLIYP
jgi:autotransporter-associated beta strand protein